jgi:hypothetical protein
MWDLLWKKCQRGRFSPKTAVSPANSHSPNATYSSIIRGWYGRSTAGRPTKWTQSYRTPRIKLINDFGCIDLILLHSERHIMSYSMQLSYLLVRSVLLVKGILVRNRLYVFSLSCPQHVKQRQRPWLYVSHFSTIHSLGMTEWYPEIESRLSNFSTF